MDKEVESIRVEVDGVFQKLKAYVNQVDSLKEENARLKKTLKEFQCALLKSQGQLRDAGITTNHNHISNGIKGNVSADAENQLNFEINNADDGDEVDCIPTSTRTAILNSLVLDNILGRLNNESLRNCRLVCQEWNDMAIRVLSKLNNGMGPGMILKDGLEYVKDRQLEKILQLSSVISSAPQRLFRKAYIDDKSLDKKGFNIMLNKSGHYLRSIKVTSELLGWNTLRRILIEWCPNLEELDFHYLQINEESGRNSDAVVLRDLQQLRILKLTTLAVNMNWRCVVQPPVVPVAAVIPPAPIEPIDPVEDDFEHDIIVDAAEPMAPAVADDEHADPEDSDSSDDEEPTVVPSQILVKEEKVIEILSAIIGASPNLKNLILKGSYAGGTAKLLRKIQSFPEVTMQLGTIFMCGTNMRGNNPLKELNQLDLSSKLKTLTISSGFEEDMMPRDELVQTLAKVGGSLNSLTLAYNNGRTINAAIVAATPCLELPVMNNLTTFKYLADVAYQLRSIDCLVKMPNLKTLFFSGSAEYFHDANPFADRLFSNCKLLMVNPHLNLQELHFYGPIEAPASLFQTMNKVIPNLSKLQVCLSPLVPNGDGVDYGPDYWNYFHEALEGISVMKGLRDLYLDFNCYRSGIGKAGLDVTQWKGVFSHLQKLPNLTHLSIHCLDNNDCWDIDHEYCDDSFPWLGEAYSSIPKLRHMTIYGYSSDLEDPTAMEKTNIQWMYERGIHLEYLDKSMDEFFEHDHQQDGNSSAPMYEAESYS